MVFTSSRVPESSLNDGLLNNFSELCQILFQILSSKNVSTVLSVDSRWRKMSKSLGFLSQGWRRTGNPEGESTEGSAKEALPPPTAPELFQ